MKGRIVLIFVLTAALLAGCSLIEEVNTTLTYATEATEFVNDVNTFGEQIPALAEQALSDPQTIDQLKVELQSMKEEITAFNVLETPAFAAELHQQLVNYNEKLMAQIDEYLQQINDNVIDLEALANSPMLETVSNITQLLNQIEQLGQ